MREALDNARRLKDPRLESLSVQTRTTSPARLVKETSRSEFLVSSGQESFGSEEDEDEGGEFAWTEEEINHVDLDQELVAARDRNLSDLIRRLRLVIRTIRASPQQQESFKSIAHRIDQEAIKEIENENHQHPLSSKDYIYMNDFDQNLSQSTKPIGTKLASVLKPLLDCKTRWSSTHRMLRRACRYRDALDEWLRVYQRKLRGSSSSLYGAAICREEWELISTMEKILLPLQIATYELSISNIPTLPNVIPLISDLQSSILLMEEATRGLTPRLKVPRIVAKGIKNAKLKLNQYCGSADKEFYYWAGSKSNLRCMLLGSP